MKVDIMNILKGMLWGAVLCALLYMCSACSHTKYVTVPEYHTEYINHTDSILLVDTLRLETLTTIREVDSTALAAFGIQLENQEKAYLVEIDKLKSEKSGKTVVRTDTIVRRDSIPYPVIQEVEKTKTDRTGWLAFAALLVVFSFVVYFKFLKK